jgi:hypothetical protein
MTFMGIDDPKQKVEKGILPIKYPKFKFNMLTFKAKMGFPESFIV